MGSGPDGDGPRRRSAAARGEDWYREVYEDHAADVLAFLLRRTDAASAHDLLSDVFLVVWRRRAVVPDADLRRAWLFRVAHNALRNQRRSEARRGRLVARLERQPLDDGLEHADAVIEDLALRNAMTRLRPSDREILRLAVWEDCSMAEIGEILRCSTNAASVRLHRARLRLRRELAAEDDAARDATGAAGEPVPIPDGGPHGWQRAVRR